MKQYISPLSTEISKAAEPTASVPRNFTEAMLEELRKEHHDCRVVCIQYCLRSY